MQYKVHYYYEGGKYTMRVAAPDTNGVLQLLSASVLNGSWSLPNDGRDIPWIHAFVRHMLKDLIYYEAWLNHVDASQLVFAEGLGE